MDFRCFLSLCLIVFLCDVLALDTVEFPNIFQNKKNMQKINTTKKTTTHTSDTTYHAHPRFSAFFFPLLSSHANHGKTVFNNGKQINK